MTQCTIEECTTNKIIARGMCEKHYRRWVRNGDPLIVKRKNVEHLTEKMCTYCKEIKQIDSFSFRTGKKSRKSYCKTCINKYQNATRYNLTLIEYDELIISNGGICCICKKIPKKIFIDHDHSCCPKQNTCGKCVRGLLCNECNLILGISKENIDVLYAAAEYLKNFRLNM